MNVIHIDGDNITLVTEFLSHCGEQQHFRYFNKRDISCVQNHFVTLIGVYENKPIAYGHIDVENSSKHWLGISVSNEYHGKGFGRQMMKAIIEAFEKSQIEDLYLTVDKENTVAVELYKKFNFTITKDESYYYEMMRHKTVSFTLQVSCGEALDKLSILEIKLEKIVDKRRVDVNKEFDLLEPILRPAIKRYHCEFLYSLLKQVNTKIWNDQDIFRVTAPSEVDFKGKLCAEIIGDNDNRFRVKNKINQRMNSTLKEQKGYDVTKALVVPHLLMGDQLLMIPLVRYLSMLYDEVHILSLEKTIEQLRMFYSDDPCIKVVKCTENWWRDVSFYEMNHVFDYNLKDIYACGIHKEYIKKVHFASCQNVPYCFYDHCEVPANIFWKYFYVNESPLSYQLADKLKDQEYVFVHSEVRAGTLFDISTVEKHLGKTVDEVLYLNPTRNVYPFDHKFYSIAQQFIGHIINDYIQTLINAPYIYITDSAFFCLAMQLGLKSSHCFVKSRNTVNYNYLWSSQFGFDPNGVGFGSNENRKSFKPF